MNRERYSRALIFLYGRLCTSAFPSLVPLLHRLLQFSNHTIRGGTHIQTNTTSGKQYSGRGHNNSSNISGMLEPSNYLDITRQGRSSRNSKPHKMAKIVLLKVAMCRAPGTRASPSGSKLAGYHHLGRILRISLCFMCVNCLVGNSFIYAIHLGERLRSLAPFYSAK